MLLALQPHHKIHQTTTMALSQKSKRFLLLLGLAYAIGGVILALFFFSLPKNDASKAQEFAAELWPFMAAIYYACALGLGVAVAFDYRALRYSSMAIKSTGAAMLLIGFALANNAAHRPVLGHSLAFAGALIAPMLIYVLVTSMGLIRPRSLP